MKKISILLFAVMMAGSLSAQIESFSDEDTFVSEPVIPTINKSDYLQPLDGSLSPCGDGYHAYNIIGEQLFCIKDAKIDSKQNYYMLVMNNANLALEKIQQGKYYTIKDILISKEEIDSLRILFNELPFISDTLDAAMQYCIPKSTALRLLQPTRSELEWPTTFQIVKSSNFEVRQAIYVLLDDTGRECYIPWYGKYDYDILNLKCDTTTTSGKFIFQRSYTSRFQPGKLVEVDAFILVSVFTNVKKIFENQRIISHRYDAWSQSNAVYICKKIALKNGQIMAAITDTSSTSIKYCPVKRMLYRTLSEYHQEDSLIFLKMDVPDTEYHEMSDGSRIPDVKYKTFDYCRVHDLDSVEAKIAYEKQKAEQEERKKDARKRQDLIKKYGTKIGQSIADGKACVGMNKEQCQEAMGTPNSIAKDTNNLGAVEVWTYSLGYQMFGGIVPVTVVTFINGKVTSVKEYTSWP